MEEAFAGAKTEVTLAELKQHLNGIIEKVMLSYDHGPEHRGGGLNSARTLLMAYRQERPGAVVPRGPEGWHRVFNLVAQEVINDRLQGRA